ncbi:MAG TPA: ATP synthase subunit I [Acidobacteriota bacterium]
MIDQTTDPKAPDAYEAAVLKRIPLEILICAGLIALAVLAWKGVWAGLFAFLGGIVAAAGFLGLERSLRHILDRGKKGALRRGLLLYGLRILLILLAFSLIIWLSPRRVLAFAAGFSALLAVVLFEAARALILLRQWKR